MEQWSMPDRHVVYEAEGIIVYMEPFVDGGYVTVAETELETLRVYEDGSRSYTHNRSGETVTYYPGNRFAMESPGQRVVEGETQFNTSE